MVIKGGKGLGSSLIKGTSTITANIFVCQSGNNNSLIIVYDYMYKIHMYGICTQVGMSRVIITVFIKNFKIFLFKPSVLMVVGRPASDMLA